ncbi:DUF1998 domain-containing protein [Roseibium denhamense]|uniref:MrfA-like Zn-binding domain-containing protein n=1 Tax=Roseibium denhamense TaxID=76305 RepID=A0ABY1PI09_9HYPH|nr:DUF1998 domain-containing protein [Roseibium denhamense]MTI04982.1 DUF1998 domain-containing protein [Roseibium denhamense]SMP33325.1 protein of unknown function [Roseibium denhamense]
MSQQELRLSQLITTFGPGSMVDLPTRSVVISGLDLWTNVGSMETIVEPRLRDMIERELKRSGRFPEDKSLSLKKPPIQEGENSRSSPGAVPALIFPEWFVCEPEATADQDQQSRISKRRLVTWRELDPAGGRRKFQSDSGRKVDVTPIRFVAACKRGHLQDIDWRFLVHGGTPCKSPMWLEDRGTSADPKDIRVTCDCGRFINMEELFSPKRLGKCRGHKPWLSKEADLDECEEDLRFLTRGATNAYFPQVASVISVPSEEDALTSLVRKFQDKLSRAKSVEMLKAFFEMDTTIGQEFSGYTAEEIFGRVQQLAADVGENEDAVIYSPKHAEFDILTSGEKFIGEDIVGSQLYAETLDRDQLNGLKKLDFSILESVVAVNRLREVSCLYGFTRLEPAPVASDGGLEEVFLAVEGAPLGSDTDWLPAVEQFGEGIFLKFSSNIIKSWLDNPAVKERVDQLRLAYRQWAQSFNNISFPGGAYIFLHSLSHILMSELALDCGYPATSLKERVYALEGQKGSGAYTKLGILIYTAGAGTQGTLGGLVSSAPNIPALIARALDRHELCSNDPICADNVPGLSPDGTTVNGSACHGCLLAPETSCEFRNMLLDRAFLRATLNPNVGFPFE